jgi:hypothetical protein
MPGGASLPCVHLEPGSISRRTPSALVDFTSCGCYRGGEKLPQERARSASMNEPIITCPNVRTEIKLTDSLPAPLIESTAGTFGYLQGIGGKTPLEFEEKDQ